MDFSWDESKREWVLAERGIDFLLAADAFVRRTSASHRTHARGRGGAISEHRCDRG